MDVVSEVSHPLRAAVVNNSGNVPKIGVSEAVEDLTASINRFQPVVETIVDELSRRQFFYKRDPGGVLKSDCICYYASYALGHLLASEGKFDIRRVNADLRGPAPYPISSHQSLLARLPDDDIVVDAAYFQYIRLLGLSAEQMPKPDVLIVPLSELEQTISTFVQLRSLNPESKLCVNYYHREDILRTDVNLTPEGLRDYFRAIWSLTSTHRVSEAGGFATGLEKFHVGTLDRDRSAEPWVLEKLVQASLI